MGKMTVEILAVAAGLGSLLPLPAAAESLHVKVTSHYDDVVQMDFYSYTRNRQWPGGGRSFTLVGSNPQTINLSCDPGEQICYGAWVKDDTHVSWGVGLRKQRKCTSCCYYCDGSTATVTLNR